MNLLAHAYSFILFFFLFNRNYKNLTFIIILLFLCLLFRVYLPPPAKMKATPLQRFLSIVFTDVYLNGLKYTTWYTEST